MGTSGIAFVPSGSIFHQTRAGGGSTRCRRVVTRSQLTGNIEDMPAEMIPQRTSEVPTHWGRAGVYGVYGKNGDLQYVAAVSNVGTAIKEHIRHVTRVEDRYAVRMMTVDKGEEEMLGQIAESWVLAHASAKGVPVGNGDAAPEWRIESVGGDIYIDPGEEIDTEIRRVLRENCVVIFMKGMRNAPRCGFSKEVVEAIGDVLGDEFVCVDCLDGRNGEVRQGIKTYSGWPTLPQVYVNGEFVGGADIIRDMVKDGSLKQVLLER